MSEPLEQHDPAAGSEATDAARDANRRIAAAAERLRFAARVPFLCECSDPGCRQFVLLRVDEYERALQDGYVILPGHTGR